MQFPLQSEAAYQAALKTGIIKDVGYGPFFEAAK
jgi:hypothetical protein